MDIQLKANLPIHGIASSTVVVDGKYIGSVREDGVRTIANPTEKSRGWGAYSKSGAPVGSWFKNQAEAVSALVKG